MKSENIKRDSLLPYPPSSRPASLREKHFLTSPVSTRSAMMQSRVQQLFDELVTTGRERGLQAAVYHNGQLVVDAWAGVADPATGARVDGATLFPTFSTTKGIAATIIHRLAERELLDYDQPVSTYWPEFAAAGKATITLRQVLNHTAGLPYLPGDLDPARLGDWAGMCALLAALPPAWPPGSRMEYHALTFGWIVGEVARRVTGCSFGELLMTEICQPLGLTDLYVGLPDNVTTPIAVLEEPGLPTASPASSAPAPVPYRIEPLGAWMNQPAARRVCSPAASGIMTARAVARHYAALLPGGVDGVELLPPARVRLATTAQFTSTGEATGRYLGYGPIDGEGTFGHGGYGGSVGLAEPARGLAVGLALNRVHHTPGEDTFVGLLDTIRQG